MLTLSDSIFLEPQKLTEIFDQIMLYLKDKAVGHDNISAYFLKAARHEITPFFDFVFREGIFPNSSKMARIIAPIYINEAKDETNNYRPIYLF